MPDCASRNFQQALPFVLLQEVYLCSEDSKENHAKSMLLKSYWCFMLVAILERFLLLKVLQNSKVLFC